MTLLTPDLIEKALDPAMAEFERLNSIRQIDTATCVHGAVSAALTAVIPDVVEKCAKEADPERFEIEAENYSPAQRRLVEAGAKAAARMIAASIRRLIPQEGK